MKCLLGLALTSAVAIAAPALADTEASRAVWERHVQAASAGDLDAVMQDFTEQSVIITPEGVLSGTAAIRGFFEDFLGGFGPEEIETVVVNADIPYDDVVVFNFTIGARERTFHDTAVIRNDRIAVLSTISYPAE